MKIQKIRKYLTRFIVLAIVMYGALAFMAANRANAAVSCYFFTQGLGVYAGYTNCADNLPTAVADPYVNIDDANGDEDICLLVTVIQFDTDDLSIQDGECDVLDGLLDTALCEDGVDTSGTIPICKDAQTPGGSTGPTSSSQQSHIVNNVIKPDLPKVPLNDQSQVKKIIEIVSMIAGTVSVLFVMIGGFRYTVSSGDPQNVKAAKDTILYAIVGLIISLAAFTIVRFVLGTI